MFRPLMKPNKNRFLLAALFTSLAALLPLTSCGTFEVGFEQGAPPVFTPLVGNVDMTEGGSATPVPTPATTVTAAEAQNHTQVEPMAEPALNPIPGPQVIAISWAGEMKGSCQSLMINYGGEADIGPCKQSARQMRPLDGRYDHEEWWRYWVDRFAPFHSQNLAPMGQINIQGLGQETASAAWQRAAAQWAELLWVELETDGRSESWTTVLSWQQEMPDRPGYCGWLQVSVYGRGEARYGPCDSETPEAQSQNWLAGIDWEQFDAWYYSKQPMSDDVLHFYGAGPLEMSAAESEDLHRWAEAIFIQLILGELTSSASEQNRASE